MTTTEWTTVQTQTSPDGKTVELRYRRFGKGPTKLDKWEIYRDGVKVNYAVNQADANANFQIALHFTQQITVTCPDGAVRHTPFTTDAEAQQWAQYGHGCLTGHTFTSQRVPAAPVQAPAEA